MELVKYSLKKTLQEQLQILFGDDVNVFVTNDFTTLFDGEVRMQDNDLLFLLSCGNGTATTTDKVFMTTPFVLTCICPIGFRNKKFVETKLYEWFSQYALKKEPLKIGTMVGTTPSYYASFDLMTPFCSGIKRLFAGQHVTDIVISGNVITCETQFSTTKAPVIKINNTVLENVFQIVTKKESCLDSFTTLGNQFQYKIESFKQFTYNIQFLYDENDEFHQSLANLTNLQCSFNIDGNSFISYAIIEVTKNVASAYTVVTITTIR